ncbi:MAG TPA: hypothetical protein VJS64_19060 [Pyrinomonadaceae bacterium]|nr:hypothetical protein [Pyrinomonadaceae bacterium]
MKAAIGLKAHSGWAALVVVGKQDHDLVILDRRRIDLVAEDWQKQPYHAAELLPPKAAHALVKRGIASAQREALLEMRKTISREKRRGNDVSTCAVLVGSDMPDWSTAEILAVHFRMHKAEGVLFRDVLQRAAKTCGLKVLAVPEKLLWTQAEAALGIPAKKLAQMTVMLGKSVGAPWGKDQKDAAVAALMALQSARK